MHTLFKSFLFTVLLFVTISSCKEVSNQADIAFAKATLETPTPLPKARTISQEFKDYWYAGKAEITSYKLEQARYGEMRDGTAMLIFVTEDFLPEVQVKADNQNATNIPVLKLNSTKNFNTGIYPYSIMNSTFYPIYKEQHALKVTQSMQEWCGHIYAQLNNRSQFEITSHSYFQGEADKSFTLEKAILENELWTQLRIDPTALPEGDLEIIPDFTYSRMKHVPLKTYKAVATIAKGSYTISYPTLNRSLIINYIPEFPYTITSWEETFKSGFGANAQELTTTATRIKTIQSPYWGKNSNKDEALRKELGL